MTWIVEKNESDAVVVFWIDGAPHEHDVSFDDEAEAVSYAIACNEDRRSSIAGQLSDQKRRRRALAKRSSNGGHHND